MQKMRTCPKCNNDQRDEDLSKPCSLCGARQYDWIGYRYAQEAEEIFLTFRIIVGLVTVAILVGVIFLAATRYQLIP
jgi:hypothetical protein